MSEKPVGKIIVVDEDVLREAIEASLLRAFAGTELQDLLDAEARWVVRDVLRHVRGSACLRTSPAGGPRKTRDAPSEGHRPRPIRSRS